MATCSVRRTDAAEAVRVHRADRIDVSGLGAPRYQADGSLLIDGYVARPGVLVYTNADGSQRRELVTREVLRDAAPGLGRKTLTLEHPDEDVSPANVAQVGVGDVDGEVTAYDDGYVRVKMCIRRQDAIEAFRSGVQELSPGYACDLVMTPGVDPEFGPYDAIQTRRDYNHVALCTRARGGPTIRARADSADVAIQTSPSAMERPMNLLTLPGFVHLLDVLKVPSAKRADADGALAAAGAAAEAIAAAAPQLEAQAAATEELKKNVATLEAALAEAKAQLAAATGTPASVEEEVMGAMEAEPMLDAAGAPVAMPAAFPAEADARAPMRQDAIRRGVLRAIAERTQLTRHADALGLPAADVAKMGNRKLRKAVLAKADPKARQDGSAEYDRARVDALDSAGAGSPFRGWFDGQPGADRRTDADTRAGEKPVNRLDAAHKARFAKPTATA